MKTEKEIEQEMKNVILKTRENVDAIRPWSYYGGYLDALKWVLED